MRRRPAALLGDVRVAGRFVLGLSGFLRRPLDGAEARAIVHARLAHRGDDLLHVVRRFVYGAVGSPYRALLRHAGCEYGDLERLVQAEGVEGALTTLFQRGVFLTIEEFKGRRPVVRGTMRLEVTPAQLVNPFIRTLLVAHSSGSRGPRTPVALDLAFVREHAVNRRLSLEARGALGWRHAVWGSPGGAEMSILLRFWIAGARVERWFTPPEAGGIPFPYRLNALAMRAGGLLAGAVLPLPAPAAPLAIARWMARALRDGATPHLKTYASMAVQLCEQAAAAGIDLGGARFTLTGEPLTPARAQSLARHGAGAAPDYGSNETGQVGEPCAAPGGPDDLHLLDDLHGVIQAGPAGPPHGLPPRALLVTSLRATAPLILLNLSMGDEADVTERSCGCALEAVGWRRHLHAVRSFEKLKTRGVTFHDTDVIWVLEEVLPARFGGAPTHYQLVEEEGVVGVARVLILVDPAVGAVDLRAVAETFRQALGDPVAWRDPESVRAISAAPRTTASGKILHLHREPGATDQPGP